MTLAVIVNWFVSYLLSAFYSLVNFLC